VEQVINGIADHEVRKKQHSTFVPAFEKEDCGAAALE